MKLLSIALVTFAALSVAGTTHEAAQLPRARAALSQENERKPAPEFQLKDASGQSAKLSDYRSKVILLDFWATWCGGCKEEMPWFSQIQRNYRAKGLKVVGVSLDDGGWKVVKPFLARAKLPYRILLGSGSTAQAYGITSMPDTFLIDRKGRLAAAYTAGVVDKGDIETNIKAILSE